MPFVLIRKTCSRALRRHALFLIRRIVSHLPYRIFKMTTPFFIKVGLFFFKKKKRVVRENLYAVFNGEKSAQEIDILVEAHFNHVLNDMIEFIFFLDHPGKIAERVEIEGSHYLDEALKKGHGAIMLSAHFGSFGLMFLRMAMRGYKSNFIIRPIRDEQIEEFITDYSARHGIRAIRALPARECVEQSLRCLKNNEILFILLDQNYSQDSAVVVDFFGRPAATATGPVVFSARSQAPILPVFITGDADGNYKISISAPVDLEVPHQEDFALARNTAQLTRIIEEQIRRYPHEWGGWMHRRWKRGAKGLFGNSKAARDAGSENEEQKIKAALSS